MKIKPYALVVLLIVSNVLWANVQSSSEFGKVRGVGIQVQVYSTLNDGKLPNSWANFIEYNPDFSSLIDFVNTGEKPISKSYSFISEEDRAKFPDGELLLIRHEPTDWPEVWKNNPPDIDASELTKEQRAELKHLADREQPIRYLVYRNERDEIDSVWWFEADVQKMLAETGIRVPEPYAYQPLIALEQTASETLSLKKNRQPESVSEVKELVNIDSVGVGEEAPQSSCWLLWLIGVLVIAGALGLFFYRK